MGERLRFDGWIAGVGTTSGTRLVLGHWPASPFGPVSDVMVEDAAGHRTLLATSSELAEFVAATYRFDAVRVVPVDVRRTAARWTVTAGGLEYAFSTGTRSPLGLLLRAVPSRLAGAPAWVRLVDVLARVALPGVRTHGSAGNGRHEWYGARDLHPIVAVTAHLDGADLGTLAPVEPPVRFGFGSTPRAPSLVRVTTTVELSPPARSRHGG
ncbi:hypothetical protein [Cryptosporangium aurantiacum]|uniref:Uncharacterized protein n=1 Tax=Cryptosporangium aurantiacum TaxID=134849 RepID=A0A1M7KWI9_9ACTN|nr:hypothetical protein [Cryptosporangium aurantiacum]SHM69960.1 hypothetical protein SAMN05443668_1011283 [Cryptosporangium aurantiacum]